MKFVFHLRRRGARPVDTVGGRCRLKLWSTLALGAWAGSTDAHRSVQVAFRPTRDYLCCAMRIISAFLFPLLAALSCPFVPSAASADVSPMRTAASLHQRELGTWDDIFACGEEELLVLRRGPELFVLPMQGAAEPRRMLSDPSVEDTEIIACRASGKKLWALLNSTRRMPFAIEVNSGTSVGFEVPGVNLEGHHPPSIQSYVFPGGASSVFLMISGSDAATWPRDGNMPMYFWMSLGTGQKTAFPVGWDLRHFSSDHRLALFTKPNPRGLDPRPLHAVDVASGKPTKEIRHTADVPVNPFDWTDTKAIKPLYLSRPENHFAGLVIEGRAVPIDITEKNADYLADAKTNGSFVALRLRRNGDGGSEPSPLWIKPLRGDGKLQKIATGAIDFEMPGQGNCITVTPGHGDKGKSSEAFIVDRTGKTLCNVLQDVERLPPLEARFSGQPYIQDQLRIRLTSGFGAPNARAILCIFDQFRNDERDDDTPDAIRLQRQRWSRAVIVSHDGHRYMTDAFRDDPNPDEVWFHSTGKVWTAKYQWKPRGSETVRQKILSETAFQLP
jgi:hypothetical protein